MCTAITYKSEDFYFGRTLDNEFSYNEKITITPRNYPFKFKSGQIINNHYAIIGMACIIDDYPLYYDAMNEKGLCIAGLNFVGNAYYEKPKYGKVNVAQFEFVPYILSKCATVDDVIKQISNINITDTPFNKNLPCAELHWLIADSEECITVEAVKEEIKIHKNPIGVLTNNPPFEEQISNLNDYMYLSKKPPENNFSGNIDFKIYSKGMGAIGLPGDLSSKSRFVRAAFIKANSLISNNEKESVGQFFHILSAVEQQRGCNETLPDQYEITIYTSCCNAKRGIYYYTTHNNRQITAVDMHKENLDSEKLIEYDLIDNEQINYQN